MNIRFTIEEENIIAIYAEDSRKRTIDNINSAMPYMQYPPATGGLWIIATI